MSSAETTSSIGYMDAPYDCHTIATRTLQWSEVASDHLVVLATKAKDREELRIPITPTLQAILDRRRVGPDGNDL